MRALIAAALAFLALPAWGQGRGSCGSHGDMTVMLGQHGERLMALMMLSVVVAPPDHPGMPPVYGEVPAELFVDMGDGSWTILVRQPVDARGLTDHWCVGAAGEQFTPETMFGSGRPS